MRAAATILAVLVLAAGCGQKGPLYLRDQPPPEAELEAFCDRLHEILAAGGRINLVQVYTVARVPAEAYVGPLSDAEVDRIVERVGRRTGLPAEAFYGPG